MKSKAALRREKLKQETKIINEKQDKVKRANEIEDNLYDLQLFKHFDKNGLKFDLNYYKVVPPQFKDWVFELTERNMKEMYEKTWGWNEKTKKQELYGESAHYLIATTDDNKPIAFANIYFEFQDGKVRIYVMEFQVEKEYQHKGIGRFILQAVEFIGLKRGMEMVALTVFRINVGAMNFYKKMHYTYHEYSPCVANPADTSLYYEILVKSLVKKTN